MSFDMSGLPESDHAPFSDDQVSAMNRYQSDERFHPYTCCDHQIMSMTSGGLKCPKCGIVQNWVLRQTLLRMMKG